MRRGAIEGLVYVLCIWLAAGATGAVIVVLLRMWP